MPDREDNPSPEYLEVEVDALLARFVNLGVLVDILIVHILLERVGEQTGPG
jgi:hypothetical protein